MKRILIVDDERQVVTMLTRMVEVLGYEGTGSLRGEDALDLVNTGYLPDLAIVDVLMPNGMDGLTLARHLRTFSGLEKLPIIALSGVAVDPIQAKAGTCDVYLVKPVTQDDLGRVVGALLKPGGDAAESRAT